MFRDGYADREYLRKYSDVPDELERHLATRTPHWASSITGLPAAKIEEIAKLYVVPEYHFYGNAGLAQARAAADRADTSRRLRTAPHRERRPCEDRQSARRDRSAREGVRWIAARRAGGRKHLAEFGFRDRRRRQRPDWRRSRAAERRRGISRQRGVGEARDSALRFHVPSISFGKVVKA